MNDIVIGVDRSETARAAAGRAVELATAFGANLHLVMCVDRGSSRDVALGGDRFHTDWLSDAEQFLTELAFQLPYEQITRAVRVGDPAEMLCDEAARLEARAIVVGNRRVQGVGRVLGSVAGGVIRQAPCDVLVANTRRSD